MANVKKVETDTGWATLRSDGTMRLYNSGYVQVLSKEQVEEVWSGSKGISWDEEVLVDFDEGSTIAQLIKDGDLPHYWAEFDGEWWDFGDEAHTIPDEDEF